jgi:hypothetical protein
MRGTGKGFEKERYPLCYEQEDNKHIFLICPETTKWREEFCVRSGWA